MKLTRIGTIGILVALTSSLAHARIVEPVLVSAPGKIYAGIFGGAASSNKFGINQYGTAFYFEDLGGPLAVNAFGKVDDRSMGVLGLNIGYQWNKYLLNPLSSGWSVAPAIELEGYGMGRETFKGTVNNNTTRLPAHTFSVEYPIRTGVFLTNALLSFNSYCLGIVHPYIGVGIGGAIASISDADALQIDPPEPGVNHYNANPSDTAATFAAQGKVGLSFDITRYASLFIEYRRLYISSTSYQFGSTVYPGHPETTYWQVSIDPQRYNIGTVGIQLSMD